ncbi:hypothetical protein HY439_00725 [Candidatus Microgenomates bacterium]|nr:hypothetical protein [Candidatus Microgenomates bacterium]
MKKFIQINLITAFLVALVLNAKPATAAVRCETQYGGGEVCVRTGQLQIDKEVFNPQENKFVDNLGITSHKFNPADEITFKLIIKNVGDAKFDKVSVSDELPSFLERTAGDLSFEITDLDPGETVEREIKAKVVSANQIPSDKTTICVVNTAKVSSGDEQDKDTAQVCIERKVLGAAIQPVTGPQDWLMILAVSFGAGITGIFLRKLTKLHLG